MYRVRKRTKALVLNFNSLKFFKFSFKLKF